MLIANAVANFEFIESLRWPGGCVAGCHDGHLHRRMHVESLLSHLFVVGTWDHDRRKSSTPWWYFWSHILAPHLLVPSPPSLLIHSPVPPYARSFCIVCYLSSLSCFSPSPIILRYPFTIWPPIPALVPPRSLPSPPSPQCFHRQQRMTSEALSLTVSECRQWVIAPRGITVQLVNGTCPALRIWLLRSTIRNRLMGTFRNGTCPALRLWVPRSAMRIRLMGTFRNGTCPGLPMWNGCSHMHNRLIKTFQSGTCPELSIWITCSALQHHSVRLFVARRGSILRQRKHKCLRARPAQYRRQCVVCACCLNHSNFNCSTFYPD